MDEQNKTPAETMNKLYETIFTMTFCTPRPTDEDIEEYKILKGGNYKMSRQEVIEELITKIGDFTHINADGIYGRLDPDVEYKLKWEKDGIQLYYDYIGQFELVILGVSRAEFDYIRNQFK